MTLLVSYVLKLPNVDHDYRMATFAGDYITATCQDFLVDPEKRCEIVQSILGKAIDVFLEDHDLLSFGYIPEFSENILYIREFMNRYKNFNVNYLEMTTARRGGVWPWTITTLSDAFQNILKKIDNNHIAFDDIRRLSEILTKSSPMSLLFPRNRTDILEGITKILPMISCVNGLDQEISTIEHCLKPETITYPYINLPSDRDTYWQNLSKSRQYYFRRYLRRFHELGGRFQKIDSTEVTEEDIGDCIRLHLSRWGSDSAVVCGDAESFHRNLGMAMAKEQMYTIFFATLNGKRIAAHTCFDIGHRREFYLPGRDPDYDNTRAGVLLVMETILDAIDCGFKVYDLGVVGFPYKMDFTDTVYTTRNFFIYKKGSQPDLEKIYNGFECMY